MYRVAYLGTCVPTGQGPIYLFIGSLGRAYNDMEGSARFHYLEPGGLFSDSGGRHTTARPSKVTELRATCINFSL